MAALQQLKRLRPMYDELVRLTMAKTAAWAAATSTCVAAFNDMPRSPGRGRGDSRLAAYADASSKLDARCAALTRTVNSVLRVIASIPDEEARQILFGYYLEHKSDNRLAWELDRTRSWVQRHRIALVEKYFGKM